MKPLPNSVLATMADDTIDLVPSIYITVMALQIRPQPFRRLLAIEHPQPPRFLLQQFD